jgi:hypothetical protein
MIQKGKVGLSRDAESAEPGGVIRSVGHRQQQSESSKAQTLREYTQIFYFHEEEVILFLRVFVCCVSCNKRC